jgi:hypothetical protein
VSKPACYYISTSKASPNSPTACKYATQHAAQRIYRPKKYCESNSTRCHASKQGANCTSLCHSKKCQSLLKKAANPADCSLRSHADQLTAYQCKLCRFGTQEVLGYEHNNIFIYIIYNNIAVQQRKMLQKNSRRRATVRRSLSCPTLIY